MTSRAALRGWMTRPPRTVGQRVEPVLECGDYPEVAAAATQRPEQLSVLVAVARRNWPSAVTTSAARRLSQVSPCLRTSQPTPPPSVSPAIPVSPTTPPVVASPKACVSWSNSCHRTPGCAQAVRADRVDPDPLHRRQVNHQPAVAHGGARDVMTAAPYRQQQLVRRGEANRFEPHRRRPHSGR